MDNLSTAIAGERQKLAAVLHNGLCQDITGLSLLAQVHLGNLIKERYPRIEEAIHLRNMLKKASEDLHALLILLRA